MQVENRYLTSTQSKQLMLRRRRFMLPIPNVAVLIWVCRTALDQGIVFWMFFTNSLLTFSMYVPQDNRRIFDFVTECAYSRVFMDLYPHCFPRQSRRFEQKVLVWQGFQAKKKLRIK